MCTEIGATMMISGVSGWPPLIPLSQSRCLHVIMYGPQRHTCNTHVHNKRQGARSNNARAMTPNVSSTQSLSVVQPVRHYTEVLHVERVEVLRGKHHNANLFGPLPGFRHGDVVAYEFQLPERFEPWPGRSRVERTFVLLDVGVSFANPCWMRCTNADGSVTEADPLGADGWYVDLVTVEVHGHRYTFRDLYIDLMVPTDGRHARMLDLDEYADALANGTLSADEAIDGLRRWQLFLDRYIHANRWPLVGWSNFPPASIRELRDLPLPFAPP